MPETRRKRFFSMPAIDQPDPEPGYIHSSEEFLIPTKDEDGNSGRCQFRAPEQLIAWASEIVASKKFPFTRDGDLMRYGLYLACVQLSRIENGVPHLQGQIDAMNQVLRSRMHLAGIVGHLEHLAEEVEKLRKMSAWGEILYLLAGERRRAAETEKFEPFWGGRWVQELKERFEMIERQAQEKLGGQFMSFKPSEGIREER